jgi:inorganic pyrophosphatase
LVLIMAKENAADGLANPVRLTPGNDKAGIIQVIVETPRGGRNKLAYDPQQKILTLSRILPAGMTFPMDFGFVPRTKADDGDPVDVLLMMDEPSYPGIAVKARILGIMKGEQTDEDKTRSRNDRILAVAIATRAYSEIETLQQVPSVLRYQLEEFFVNYHRLQGRKYKPIGWSGADEVRRVLTSVWEVLCSRSLYPFGWLSTDCRGRKQT